MTNQYVNAKGVQFVRDSLADFPRPDRAAADAIRQWASERSMDLDPDRVDAVTLHCQFNPEHGWVAVIAQKMTLTQAVLSNWQGESANNWLGAAIGEPWAGELPDGLTLTDSLRGQGLLDYHAPYIVYNGLFRQTDTTQYNTNTHVPLAAEDFQSFIWSLDFHGHYKSMLDTYWDANLEKYRIGAKINFIAACNKQVTEGSLSDAGRRLAWQASGLEATPAAMPGDGTSSGKPRIRARLLNVYGYTATDLLCLRDAVSGLVLLYIPGNASPLHEFSDKQALMDWFAEQCRAPDTRDALQSHFALADREDGLSYSGLHTALCGLGSYPQPYHLDSNRPGFTAEGIWPPRDYINYKAKDYSPLIEGDVFLTLAKRQKQRSYQDAHFIITSDSEVTKAKWRGYLNSAINVLAPLALVVPELAPLFALGGIAQFGLGLDQAIQGKNAQEKAEGVSESVFGLLNAAPLITAGVAKAPELFSFKKSGFVMPSRVNEQLGYPLSPVTPPQLPIAEVADYFHSPDSIAPLPGADTATAGAIVRTPRYDGSPDLLSAMIGGYHSDMLYDMEADAFCLMSDFNEVEPRYYIATSGSRNVVEVDVQTRQVTDDMRMATLRALGVDLTLPIDLPAVNTEDLRPIPKQIMNLWVGNNVIPQELIDNIASNTLNLQGSEYALRLYLTNAEPAVFQENLRLLAEHAPAVEVLPLEDQPFYASFRESGNYAQYQAAIDGNGGVASNYASAADVLRFALLEEEGGLYMDIDDTLLAPGEHPAVIDGVPMGLPGERLDDVELATRKNGLLLHPPVSNEEMSMNNLYNSSLIGSHPGNPTLRAIREEMQARFLEEPGFYDSKPSKETDPQAFSRYAQTLCRLTGPGLLTDMVDRHLPELGVIRQIVNLYAFPRTNSWRFVNLSDLQAVQKQMLPLNRIAKIGGYSSWVRPSVGAPV
ncbi:dermonecrotic toxin domain-containing protein [Pseudomonas putida]|uniref:dermonecrotic toxin domain-containing protein n=1 Tax=Pseudomonas putida TaxID=303 RepID=UPI0020C2E119|nr:DUF6543 domain-containing protein [Pseudomonas putida]UTL79858.1 mannosyltransferase [Pseudomonas putida]